MHITGVTAIDDDPQVGHALEADLVEHRVEAHPVLDHHLVRQSAEAELAAQRIGEVMLHLAPVEQPAAAGPIAALATVHDDQDAVPLAAMGRLEDEVRWSAIIAGSLRISCGVAIEPYSAGTGTPWRIASSLVSSLLSTIG
jgi:hypothetical protein